MRDYLISFLNRQEYSKEDLEYLVSCYDKIQNNATAKECFEKALKLYDEDINCEYGDIIGLADAAAKELYIKLGIKERAEKEIEKFFTRALAELDTLPISEEQLEQLHKYARKITFRDK